MPRLPPTSRRGLPYAIAIRAAISAVVIAGMFVATYALATLLLGRLPDAGEREVLVATLVVSSIAVNALGPARKRATAFMGRALIGERETAIRDFAGRLSRAIPLDELLLQLAEYLRDTLMLSAAEVWTESEGALELAASDPERPASTLPLAAGTTDALLAGPLRGSHWVATWLPGLCDGREDSSLVVAAITSSGDLFGLLVAERPHARHALGSEDEAVLRDLAREMGPVLRNARLDAKLNESVVALRRQTHELQASRARVVKAADAERRRVERNLHDGAQQHLVALSVNLRLARELAAERPAEAAELLAQLEQTAEEGLRELRQLVHGIFPPVLAARGLPRALGAVARRLPIHTTVRVQERRYDSNVEAAVYFCCLEALQNAAKHAGSDARVVIEVQEQHGALVMRLSDDGPGFDPTTAARGDGLASMRDRLAALGGSLEIDSSPGRGTTVSGRIPLRTV